MKGHYNGSTFTVVGGTLYCMGSLYSEEWGVYIVSGGTSSVWGWGIYYIDICIQEARHM